MKVHSSQIPHAKIEDKPSPVTKIEGREYIADSRVKEGNLHKSQIQETQVNPVSKKEYVNLLERGIETAKRKGDKAYEKNLMQEYRQFKGKPF